MTFFDYDSGDVETAARLAREDADPDAGPEVWDYTVPPFRKMTAPARRRPVVESRSNRCACVPREVCVGVCERARRVADAADDKRRESA